MRFTNRFIAIGLALVIAGLLPQTGMAKKPKKGYVVMRVIGEEGKIRMSVARRNLKGVGKLLGKGKTFRFESGEMKKFKLRGGLNYYFDNYYPLIYGNGRFEIRDGAVEFQIEPGVIKYVGDVHLIISDDKKGVRLRVEIKDGEESVKAELQKEYAYLLKKYKYKKELITPDLNAKNPKK